LTMYSALVVVYTAYCALQIVRLTLHYITLLNFYKVLSDFEIPQKYTLYSHIIILLASQHNVGLCEYVPLAKHSARWL